MTQPNDERSVESLPMEHGDSVVAGPGFVATKSQTKGSLAGVLLGTAAGVVLGIIGGALIGGGWWILGGAVIFGVAGATAGGMIGGFVKPKHDSPMEGGSAY